MTTQAATAATPASAEAASYPPKLSPIQMRCKHCWYNPEKFPEGSVKLQTEREPAD